MEDSERIYEILKQKNVQFTLFNEIGTIIFDVQNSSQKLIRKILANACQYEDTQIILDLGVHHSKNIIRRMIKILKEKHIQATKIVLRFSSNNTTENNIIEYINLVPQVNNLTEKICFHPKQNIELSYHNMQLTFLSDHKLRFILGECKVDLLFTVEKKMNNNINESNCNSMTLVDQNTKLPILSNFEKVIYAHLPLYGVSDKEFKIILKELINFELNGDCLTISTQIICILIDDFIDLQQKANIQIDKFILCYKNQNEYVQLFDKAMELKSVNDNQGQSLISKLIIENSTDIFHFDFKLQSLINRTQSASNEKIPLLKIDLPISKLNINFYHPHHKIDFGEHILRCRQYQQLQDIDIEIQYSDNSKINLLMINDLLDLLSKLKSVTYTSVKIKNSCLYSSLFEITYEKSNQSYLIQPTQTFIDIIPNLIFRKEAYNLIIKFHYQFMIFDSFNKVLLPLLQNSNLNKCINLQFLKQTSNLSVFCQESTENILKQFQQIQLNFFDTNQFLTFNIAKEYCQKVWKIFITNFQWPVQRQISSIIENYPNLLQLKIYFNLDYKSQIETINKYFIIKNSLSLLIKYRNPKFKRQEILEDVLFEFLI